MNYAFAHDGQDGEIAHQVNGGVLYSGRRDLSLGVIGGYQPSPDFTLITGVLAMQYFF